MNKKTQSALLLGGLLLGFIGCNVPTKKAIGIDLSLIDKEIRPQDDFYNYVNGT